ncbi:hypothetical protein C0989_012461 [Termitomyces sp. Mn162]|nr:hypothetical protein C0989_012461 [Termitomyces sp. Mn162]
MRGEGVVGGKIIVGGNELGGRGSLGVQFGFGGLVPAVEGAGNRVHPGAWQETHDMSGGLVKEPPCRVEGPQDVEDSIEFFLLGGNEGQDLNPCSSLSQLIPRTPDLVPSHLASPELPPHSPFNSPNLCSPIAPTPGNSDTYPANTDSLLVNSNAFPTAFDTSPASPELLGPSPTVSDAGMHHQFVILTYSTSSGASHQAQDSLHPQLIPSVYHHSPPLDHN